VFEATDLRLQRRVAAKVMMGSLFGNPTALRRFEREAPAAAKIDATLRGFTTMGRSDQAARI